MNDSIFTPPVSTPISTGVYDLDTLQSECRFLGIPATRPNVRRVRRAFHLVENHRVRLVDRFGKIRIYEVDSQMRDLVHLVVANGDNRCTCEDARKRQDFTGCKHSIAVRIYEERIADYDSYLDWLAMNTYQQAKVRINHEPPISYNRPDSLTRRGDVLIARFAYNHWWTADNAIADWQSVILYLFPNANIITTTADRQNHIRCYFSL